MLAHYGEAAHHLCVPNPSPPRGNGRRWSCVADRSAICAPPSSIGSRRAHPAVQASLRRSIAALTAELTALDRAIDAALAADPLPAQTAQLLQSAPGIGKVIAATVVTELPELGTLSAKEVAALVGVAPHLHQSGRAPGSAAIQGGRSAVRAMLYLAAVTAARCDPRIKAFYTQLCARGKPRKVALIACEHKLLTILNAMVRDSTPWRKEPAMA